MLVAYGRIAHTLWFHAAPGEVTLTGLDSAGTCKRLDERKRVVRMLIIIVSVFAVSWFPFFTLQVDHYESSTLHCHRAYYGRRITPTVGIVIGLRTGADPGVARRRMDWRRLGRVERRRREYRGAKGPEVMGCPLPTGARMGCAPSPEKFSIFELKMRVLVHSGTDKTYF